MATQQVLQAAELRKRHIEARKQLTPQQRARASEAICRRLVRSRRFAAAERIAVYLATPYEANIDGFIDTAWTCGKQVYLPRIARKGEMFFVRLQPDSPVSRNRFGILEVENGEITPARELDWILLPLVVFDSRANRIGMGGGYYDRALAFASHRHRSLKPWLTGVAFACQETEEIVANPWDIGVSRVYTERQ